VYDIHSHTLGYDNAIDTMNSTQGAWHMLWILLTSNHFTSAAHTMASLRLLGRLGNTKTNIKKQTAYYMPIIYLQANTL